MSGRAGAQSHAMQIAPASHEDLEAVARVHVLSWQGAYADVLPPAYLASLSVERRASGWRQVLAQGTSELLVARQGDEIAGFVSCGRSRDQDAAAGTGEIWAIYVAPRHWSTGVGKALWLAARERLAAMGCSTVTLWVLAGNARAIAFYQAQGFAIDAASAKQIEVGGVALTEVRLALALGPAQAARTAP